MRPEVKKQILLHLPYLLFCDIFRKQGGKHHTNRLRSCTCKIIQRYRNRKTSDIDRSSGDRICG